MKKLTLLFVAMCLVMGSLCISSNAFAADYTLRIVFLANTEDEDYDGSLTFKQYVESRSNGRISVEIYPGGQLCGNEKECIECLQTNIIQIHQMTIGGISQAYPAIQFLDLPYLMDNDRVAEEVLSGPFLGEMREKVLKKTGNIRLMVFSNTGGWRNFANTKRQVETPEDLKGLKIRTITSPLQQELVKLLGGSATPLPWPDVYTSLATGVIDGTKNGITDITGMKFHEHVKFITLDGHAYMTSLWLMNNEAFMALPDDLKRIVNDGFYHLRQVTTALPKRRSIEAYNEFTEAGGAIYVPTSEQKEQFRSMAAPLKDWYLEKYGDEGRELLDLFEKRVKEAEAKVKAEVDQNM